MRAVIFALAAVLVVTGAAEAHSCAGQGSDRVLTFSGWGLADGKSHVEVDYQLSDTKTPTRLQGHVYFQIAPDDVLADAAIELTDATGVPSFDTVTLTLSKDGARRLAEADHKDVSVFACTNYIEYLDGSGVIID